MATICLNQEVGPRPSSRQYPQYPPPIQKIIPDIFFFFYLFISGLIMWLFERLDRMV